MVQDEIIVNPPNNQIFAEVAGVEMRNPAKL